MALIKIKEMHGAFSYIGNIIETLDDIDSFNLIQTFQDIYAFNRLCKKSLVMVITRGTLPIAIVPFAIMTELFNKLPARKAKLKPCFINYSERKQAIKEIFDYLSEIKRCWDVVDFCDIDYDPETVGLFETEAKRLNFKLAAKEISPDPYIDLTGSWEGYWSGRKVSFRKNLKRAYKRMETLGDMDININVYDSVQSEDIRKGLEKMFELSIKSWKAELNSAMGSTEENRRFYTTLIETFSRHAKIAFSFLEHKGTPVSGLAGIIYKDTYYALKTYYDEKYAHISPGYLLLYSILENLFGKNGIKRVELFRGTLEYKLKWLTGTQRRASIFIFKNSLNSHILRFSETHIRGWLGLNKGNINYDKNTEDFKLR